MVGPADGSAVGSREGMAEGTNVGRLDVEGATDVVGCSDKVGDPVGAGDSVGGGGGIGAVPSGGNVNPSPSPATKTASLVSLDRLAGDTKITTTTINATTTTNTSAMMVANVLAYLPLIKGGTGAKLFRFSFSCCFFFARESASLQVASSLRVSSALG